MKLEQIPKRDIFEVPEGYFDRLPGRIQAATTARVSPRPVPLLRWAMVAGSLATVAVVWFLLQPGPSIEKQLARIDTGALVTYLEVTGGASEEYLAEIDLTWEDSQALEEAVLNTIWQEMPNGEEADNFWNEL